MEGDPLLGDDFEGTTDASHPNDLGFLRLAEVFSAYFKKGTKTGIAPFFQSE